MTDLLIAAGVVLATVVALVYDRWYRSRILRQHERKTVIVTLKGGDWFKGILFELDRDAFVLRGASTVAGDGTDRVASAVDGEIVILRQDVAYLQFV